MKATKLIIIALMLSVLSMSALAEDVPEDLFKRVKQYNTVFLRCPAEPTLENVKQVLELKSRSYATDLLSPNDVLNHCKNNRYFKVEASALPKHITECMTILAAEFESIIQNDLNVFREELIEECEVRNYLDKKYDSATYESKIKEREIIFNNNLLRQQQRLQNAGNGIDENDEGSVVAINTTKDEINTSVIIPAILESNTNTSKSLVSKLVAAVGNFTNDTIESLAENISVILGRK